MDLKSLRRLYLLAAIKRAGGNRRLSEMLGTNEDHISTMKNGGREVGDEIASRIELVYGYPAWGISQSSLLRAAAIEMLDNQDDIDDLLIAKLNRAGNSDIANLVKCDIPPLMLNESRCLSPEERKLAAKQMIDNTINEMRLSNDKKDSIHRGKSRTKKSE